MEYPNRHMLRTFVLLLIAAAAFAQTPKTNVQSGKRYPRIVIRGAMVVDGSGGGETKVVLVVVVEGWEAWWERLWLMQALA